MLSSTLVLTLLVFGVLASQDRANNQLAMEGLWSYFDLDGPTTVSQCGSDADQTEAHLYMGYVLKRAEIAQSQDISPLIKETEQFYNGLSAETRACFENNQEVRDLAHHLGIDQYEGDEFELKVQNWVGSHFLVYKKLIKAASADWNSYKEYYDAGQDIAELLNRILTDAEK